jgi:hypothetical protein
MANGSGGLIGGLAGGLLGLAGGAISAVEQRRAQTRFRRRQRGAIQEARTFADERVQAITGGGLFQQAEQFLSRTFSDGTTNPLVSDFSKRLAATQAQRGVFFGGAAAVDVAGGAAGFLQQQRQSLLPTALQFAFEPERIRQSVLGFEAPLRVAAATGAALPGITPPRQTPGVVSSALNNAISGAAGGFAVGRQFGGQGGATSSRVFGDSGGQLQALTDSELRASSFGQQAGFLDLIQSQIARVQGVA